MTSTHCTYCQGRSRSLLHNNMTAILYIFYYVLVCNTKSYSLPTPPVSDHFPSRQALLHVSQMGLIFSKILLQFFEGWLTSIPFSW